MKAETKHEAMTRLAGEFSQLLRDIDERFHDLPAPETDSLTWAHVGIAGQICDKLQETLDDLTP